MPFFTSYYDLKKPTETEELETKDYNDNLDEIDQILFRHISNNQAHGLGTSSFAFNTELGLRQWRAALAKVLVNSEKINVAWLGTSQTEGCMASGIEKSYVDLVRTVFSNKFGNVGTGFIPTYYPTNTTTLGAKKWTFAGTGWSNQTNDGYGIANDHMLSNTNGDTATISFNGTGIGFVCVSGSGTGQFTVQIDGGTAVNFDTYNVDLSGARKYEVTGLTDATHTAVLTVGNNGKNIRLIGAYPIKGSSGVTVHNLGKYGSNAESFTSEYCLDSEIKVWEPALTIIEIMGNDWTEQTPLDEYRQHIQTLITTAKQYGDVLLISIGFNLDSHPIPQTSYISVLKNLALSNNVALLDIIGKYGGDTNYVKNTLGLLYEDNTHPNDAGHQDKATSIINILLNH